MWRKHRYDNDPAQPDDCRLITSAWDPPEEGWIIAGGNLPQDASGRCINVWDGEKIVFVPLSKLK